MSLLASALEVIHSAPISKAEKQFLRKRAVEVHLSTPDGTQSSFQKMPFNSANIELLKLINEKMHMNSSTVAQALRVLHLRQQPLSSKTRRALREIDAAASYERHPGKIEELKRMVAAELGGTEFFPLDDTSNGETMRSSTPESESAADNEEAMSVDGDLSNGKMKEPETSAIHRPMMVTVCNPPLVNLNEMDGVEEDEKIVINVATTNAFQALQMEVEGDAGSSCQQNAASSEISGLPAVVSPTVTKVDEIMHDAAVTPMSQMPTPFDKIMGLSASTSLSQADALPEVPPMPFEIPSVENCEKTAIPTAAADKPVVPSVCFGGQFEFVCSKVDMADNGVFAIDGEEEAGNEYKPITVLHKPSPKSELGDLLTLLHKEQENLAGFTIVVTQWRPLPGKPLFKVMLSGYLGSVFDRSGYQDAHIWLHGKKPVEWSEPYEILSGAHEISENEVE